MWDCRFEVRFRFFVFFLVEFWDVCLYSTTEFQISVSRQICFDFFRLKARILLYFFKPAKCSRV